jgi:hypothetical protein
LLSGTYVENIEASFSGHDGVACVGGSVDLKYVSVLYNALNGLAVDGGYNGRVQFLVALVGEIYHQAH